jgi:rhs family protein
LLHEWKTFDYKDTAPKDCITWVFQSFVPVAKIQGDKHYSIISDHLGTPILATDEQGNKVWERVLDIYGRVRKEEGGKGFCCFLLNRQNYENNRSLRYIKCLYVDTLYNSK